MVHLTSAAVNGLPSCHLTPRRSGKVSSVPSSFHAQPVVEIGDDRAHAVLRHVLVEHDQIVEHARHWPVDGLRRFLEHRHARRAVEVPQPQDTAVRLSERRIGG